MLTLAIPNYNGARFLSETLVSLQRNSPNVRWYLQDAGSTDGSLEIAGRHASASDVIVVEPDAGQADGLNRAMSHMGGDVIGFLNSDDLLADNAAERILEELARDSSVDLVYGEVDWIDEHGHNTGHHSGELSALSDVLDIYKVWWNGRQWVQPEVFWRRRVWEQVGAFDTRYELAFDYDYWVRCFRKQVKVKKIPHTLAKFRLHRAQKSSNAGKAAIEIRTIVAKSLSDPNLPYWPGKSQLERMLAFDYYQSGQRYPDGRRPSLLSMVLRHPGWLYVPEVRRRVGSKIRRLWNIGT
ncbi:MAG: glycosyltransferase family 2 protein [Bryobacteraceae bacterium]